MTGLRNGAREGVALVGVVLLALGVWGTGIIGGTLRTSDAQTTRTVVSNSEGTETTTVTATIAPEAALSENTALALLGLGVLLLLIAVTWDRIRKITGPGGIGIEWTDVVDQTVKALSEQKARGEDTAEPIEAVTKILVGGEKGSQIRKEMVQAAERERAGDPARARQIRAGAMELLGALEQIGDSLADSRTKYSGAIGRIHAQDDLRRARELAAEAKPDREDVLATLDHAHPEARPLALAMMLGHPPSADLDLLLAVLNGPSTGEERDLALRTTHRILDRLSPTERSTLAGALESLQARARAAGDAYTPLMTMTQLRDIKKLEGAGRSAPT